MQFYDRVKVSFQSGAGGNGAVSGRREKYVAHGGPNGGDGGNGGDIIIKADKNENTLLNFRYKKKIKAENGTQGKSRNKHGRKGKNLVVNVPIGTLLKDSETEENIYQFLYDGEEYKLLRGGKGGAGNVHFKSSTNQFPRFALYGEPGSEKDIILELQLLGDVALIGSPSVGKSTMINTVSNVKAKTAEYPFTTIVPNLGMVKYNNFDFSIVDIPGLIEGASDGKGIGNEFLRHILKAKIWSFMLDVSNGEEGIDKFIENFDEIKKYIENRFIGSTDFGENMINISYNITFNENINFEVLGEFENGEVKLILKKMIYVVFAKFDIADKYEDDYKKLIFDKIKSYFKDGFDIDVPYDCFEKNISTISSFTYYGINDFLETVFNKITSFKSIDFYDISVSNINISDKNYVKDITEYEKEVLLEEGYIDEEEIENKRIYEIFNPRLAYYVFVTPWGNDEAEIRFWEQINKFGFDKFFSKRGIKRNSLLKIISPYNNKDYMYLNF